MPRVVVVCGIHEHGMGHRRLQHGVDGRGQETGNRDPTILVHQSA